MKVWPLAFAAGLVACSSASGALDPSDGSPLAPSAPAAADGGLDATSSGATTGGCDDCEYFPETCSPDVLCPNGPFGPGVPGGSIDPRTWINVIRGRSPTDVWVAGAVGALAHFDGMSWSRSDLGSQETMRALWLRDSEEITFGLLNRIYARGVDVPDGGAAPSADGWAVHSPAYLGQAPSGLVRSAWAAPVSDWLWCASRRDGLWRLHRSRSTAFEGAASIENRVCNIVGCRLVNSFHGASANELWAVGESGVTIRILEAESDAPTVKGFNSSTRDSLNGVWEASTLEAWSVGAMGTVRHYAGEPTGWEAVSDVPTRVDLNAVSGSSPSDVWAVGDAGVVLHYNGKIWSRVAIAGLGSDRPSLTTIWIVAPGRIWVGGQGVILSLGGTP